MRRTYQQRVAYARRRMSLAVDRQITAPEAERERLGRWVLAWARLANIRNALR